MVVRIRVHDHLLAIPIQSGVDLDSNILARNRHSDCGHRLVCNLRFYNFVQGGAGLALRSHRLVLTPTRRAGTPSTAR